MKNDMNTEAELVELAFPNFPKGRGGTEVNGLEANALDQLKANPEVTSFESHVSAFDKDRHFFNINIRGATIVGRICDAMEGSEYAKFAVIHGIAQEGNEKDINYLRGFYDRQTRK